jgi:hypothetical protein
MSNAPSRVVTGHTLDGVSVVLSDGPVRVSRELPEDGVAFHEIWNASGAPAPISAPTRRSTRPSASAPYLPRADRSRRANARSVPRSARLPHSTAQDPNVQAIGHSSSSRTMSGAIGLDRVIPWIRWFRDWLCSPWWVPLFSAS